MLQSLEILALVIQAETREVFTQGLSDVTSWQMHTLGARAESLNKNQRICSWFTNLDLGLSLEELREGSGCPGGFDGVPKGAHPLPGMEGGEKQDKTLQLWQTAL